MHAVCQETNKEREILKNLTFVVVEQMRRILLRKIPVMAVGNYILKKTVHMMPNICFKCEGKKDI